MNDTRNTANAQHLDATRRAEIAALFEALAVRDYVRAFSYAHNLAVWGWPDAPYWLQKARTGMRAMNEVQQ